MDRSWSDLDLPGFRFHPTEEELLDFYLKGAVHGNKVQPEIIRTLNLYRHDPWELPGMAKIGEREWYFFVPRDRSCSNGGRPNRTTERGFWKATGSDRPIHSVCDPKPRLIGHKRTLVFYEGRAPRGTRTDWIMNEYRLPEDTTIASASPLKEDMVLCKIYRKATSMKELEQRAAMDKDASAMQCGASATDNSSSSSSTSSSSVRVMTTLHKLPTLPRAETDEGIKEMKAEMETVNEAAVTSVPLGSETCRERMLPELEMLQLPPKLGFDCTQDPFLALLRSPWPDNWSPN